MLFYSVGVVALSWTDDKSDPQYEISHEKLRDLKKFTDAKAVN